MTFRDTLDLALRNLSQAKLRTSLTTMGVSIGIASLAGMVSLGVGLQEQFVGRFTKSGMFDAITVMSASDRPGGLAQLGGAGRRGFGGGRRGGAPATPPRALDEAAVRELAAVEQVRDVYPNIRVPVELKFGEVSELTVATGIPMSSRDEGPFQTLTSGAFFANETERACMLSLDMAKRLTDRDPGELIGRSVNVSYATSAGGAPVPSSDPMNPFQIQRVEAAFRIVGIVERESGPAIGGIAVTALMIPLAQAKAIAAEALTNPRAILTEPAARGYQSITVKVTRAQFTEDVEDRIKKLGYSAFSINDALRGAKRAFLILDIVLSLIGSIALTVSSLGIVNTMVMSILERTREIGIMKAIGGSDGDIRRIFLIEASAIGLLGGVAGVAIGWLVGRVINAGANVYIRSQGGTPGNLFSLPWWLIGGAIGFSIVVSLLAGSYPARRAARLDPIRALRHD